METLQMILYSWILKCEEWNLWITQCGFYYYDQKGVISGQYGSLRKKLAISIKVDLKVPLKKKSVCLIFDLFLEK